MFLRHLYLYKYFYAIYIYKDNVRKFLKKIVYIYFNY